MTCTLDRESHGFQGLPGRLLAIGSLTAILTLLTAIASHADPESQPALEEDAPIDLQMKIIRPSEKIYKEEDGPLVFGDKKPEIIEYEDELPSSDPMAAEEDSSLHTVEEGSGLAQEPDEPQKSNGLSDSEETEKAITAEEIREATASTEDVEPEEMEIPKTKEAVNEWVTKTIKSVAPGASYPTELKNLSSLGEKAAPKLGSIFLSSSEDWQSRWIAAMALGKIGGERAIQSLKEGLSDPLFLVRLASVQALGQMRDVRHASDIRKAVEDEALVVRSSAIRVLGDWQDETSVSTLSKELTAPRSFHRGKSLWIREEIIRSLAKIGSEQAAKTLLDVLKEDEEEVREKACLALASVYPQATYQLDQNIFAGEQCHQAWLSWQNDREKQGQTEKEER